jgi:hypothetical protein
MRECPRVYVYCADYEQLLEKFDTYTETDQERIQQVMVRALSLQSVQVCPPNLRVFGDSHPVSSQFMIN